MVPFEEKSIKVWYSKGQSTMNLNPQLLAPGVLIAEVSHIGLVLTAADKTSWGRRSLVGQLGSRAIVDSTEFK